MVTIANSLGPIRAALSRLCMTFKKPSIISRVLICFHRIRPTGSWVLSIPLHTFRYLPGQSYRRRERRYPSLPFFILAFGLCLGLVA